MSQTTPPEQAKMLLAKAKVHEHEVQSNIYYCLVEVYDQNLPISTHFLSFSKCWDGCRV